MELTNHSTTITPDVATLKDVLLRRLTTRPRFRFPLTTEQTVTLLTAAYIAEVELRGGKCEFSDELQSNIHRLAVFLTSDTRRFGVMFCGLCGNGKTTLLYAFQNAYHWLCDHDAFSVRRSRLNIIDARELAEKAKDFKEFRKIRDCQMIAIEDMGRESNEVLDYGNVLNPVRDTIEYRYDKQLFTVITTNLNPKEVREKYGMRIADRFNEMLEVIVFSNDTYRRTSQCG